MKLEDVLNQPLKTTGSDIPEGSYPATLYKFGEPFEVDNTKGKFYREGQPKTRVVFEACFGIFDKSGKLESLDYLIPVPDGGAANKKSNLYKMLKGLATGTALMSSEGEFAAGTTLKSFVGTNGVVSVKKNDQDFANVSGVAPKMEGAKYPTIEECATLKGSDNIPF
jgi:hypothetical protein